MYKVRVWDLPTRVFHWLLALCVIGLVATGQIGGSAMEWHFRLGYAVLSLLGFRLFWGFFGGRWSRFSSFIYSPRDLCSYLKGQEVPDAHVGHSPLGALSVFALLLAALAQASAGLMSDDEISTTGPLAKMVASSWVELATFFHTEVGKIILIVLVAVHVLAVLVYRFKKHNDLITPMLTGDKHLPEAVEPSKDNLGSRALALVLLAVAVGAVLALLRWAA
jgi:cytochrome b